MIRGNSGAASDEEVWVEFVSTAISIKGHHVESVFNFSRACEFVKAIKGLLLCGSRYVYGEEASSDWNLHLPISIDFTDVMVLFHESHEKASRKSLNSIIMYMANLSGLIHPDSAPVHLSGGGSRDTDLLSGSMQKVAVFTYSSANKNMERHLLTTSPMINFSASAKDKMFYLYVSNDLSLSGGSDSLHNDTVSSSPLSIRLSHEQTQSIIHICSQLNQECKIHWSHNWGIAASFAPLTISFIDTSSNREGFSKVSSSLSKQDFGILMLEDLSFEFRRGADTSINFKCQSYNLNLFQSSFGITGSNALLMEKTTPGKQPVIHFESDNNRTICKGGTENEISSMLSQFLPLLDGLKQHRWEVYLPDARIEIYERREEHDPTSTLSPSQNQINGSITLKFLNEESKGQAQSSENPIFFTCSISDYSLIVSSHDQSSRPFVPLVCSKSSLTLVCQLSDWDAGNHWTHADISCSASQGTLHVASLKKKKKEKKKISKLSGGHDSKDDPLAVFVRLCPDLRRSASSFCAFLDSFKSFHFLRGGMEPSSQIKKKIVGTDSAPSCNRSLSLSFSIPTLRLITTDAMGANGTVRAGVTELDIRWDLRSWNLASGRQRAPFSTLDDDPLAFMPNAFCSALGWDVEDLQALTINASSIYTMVVDFFNYRNLVWEPLLEAAEWRWEWDQRLERLPMQPSPRNSRRLSELSSSVGLSIDGSSSANINLSVTALQQMLGFLDLWSKVGETSLSPNVTQSSVTPREADPNRSLEINMLSTVDRGSLSASGTSIDKTTCIFSVTNELGVKVVVSPFVGDMRAAEQQETNESTRIEILDMSTARVFDSLVSLTLTSDENQQISFSPIDVRKEGTTVYTHFCPFTAEADSSELVVPATSQPRIICHVTCTAGHFVLTLRAPLHIANHTSQDIDIRFQTVPMLMNPDFTSVTDSLSSMEPTEEEVDETLEEQTWSFKVPAMGTCRLPYFILSEGYFQVSPRFTETTEAQIAETSYSTPVELPIWPSVSAELVSTQEEMKSEQSELVSENLDASRSFLAESGGSEEAGTVPSPESKKNQHSTTSYSPPLENAQGKANDPVSLLGEDPLQPIVLSSRVCKQVVVESDALAIESSKWHAHVEVSDKVISLPLGIESCFRQCVWRRCINIGGTFEIQNLLHTQLRYKVSCPQIKSLPPQSLEPGQKAAHAFPPSLLSQMSIQWCVMGRWTTLRTLNTAPTKGHEGPSKWPLGKLQGESKAPGATDSSGCVFVQRTIKTGGHDELLQKVELKVYSPYIVCNSFRSKLGIRHALEDDTRFIPPLLHSGDQTSSLLSLPSHDTCGLLEDGQELKFSMKHGDEESGLTSKLVDLPSAGSETITVVIPLNTASSSIGAHEAVVSCSSLPAPFAQTSVVHVRPRYTFHNFLAATKSPLLIRQFGTAVVFQLQPGASSGNLVLLGASSPTTPVDFFWADCILPRLVQIAFQPDENAHVLDEKYTKPAWSSPFALGSSVTFVKLRRYNPGGLLSLANTSVMVKVAPLGRECSILDICFALAKLTESPYQIVNKTEHRIRVQQYMPEKAMKKDSIDPSQATKINLLAGHVANFCWDWPMGPHILSVEQVDRVSSRMHDFASSQKPKLTFSYDVKHLGPTTVVTIAPAGHRFWHPFRYSPRNEGMSHLCLEDGTLLLNFDEISISPVSTSLVQVMTAEAEAEGKRKDEDKSNTVSEEAEVPNKVVVEKPTLTEPSASPSPPSMERLQTAPASAGRRNSFKLQLPSISHVSKSPSGGERTFSGRTPGTRVRRKSLPMIKSPRLLSHSSSVRSKRSSPVTLQTPTEGETDCSDAIPGVPLDRSGNRRRRRPSFSSLSFSLLSSSNPASASSTNPKSNAHPTSLAASNLHISDLVLRAPLQSMETRQQHTKALQYGIYRVKIAFCDSTADCTVFFLPSTSSLTSTPLSSAAPTPSSFTSASNSTPTSTRTSGSVCTPTSSSSSSLSSSSSSASSSSSSSSSTSGNSNLSTSKNDDDADHDDEDDNIVTTSTSSCSSSVSSPNQDSSLTSSSSPSSIELDTQELVINWKETIVIEGKAESETPPKNQFLTIEIYYAPLNGDDGLRRDHRDSRTSNSQNLIKPADKSDFPEQPTVSGHNFTLLSSSTLPPTEFLRQDGQSLTQSLCLKIGDGEAELQFNTCWEKRERNQVCSSRSSNTGEEILETPERSVIPRKGTEKVEAIDETKGLAFQKFKQSAENTKVSGSEDEKKLDTKKGLVLNITISRLGVSLIDYSISHVMELDSVRHQQQPAAHDSKVNCSLGLEAIPGMSPAQRLEGSHEPSWKEILYIHFQDIRLKLQDLPEKKSWWFSIRDLQVDNGASLPFDPISFPVVLFKTHRIAPPVLQAALVQRKSPDVSSQIFEYSSFLVQALSLRINPVWVRALSNFVDCILRVLKANRRSELEPHSSIAANPNTAHSKGFPTRILYQPKVISLSTEGKRTYFSHLLLSPLELNLSLHESPEPSQWGGSKATTARHKCVPLVTHRPKLRDAPTVTTFLFREAFFQEHRRIPLYWSQVPVRLNALAMSRVWFPSPSAIYHHGLDYYCQSTLISLHEAGCIEGFACLSRSDTLSQALWSTYSPVTREFFFHAENGNVLAPAQVSSTPHELPQIALDFCSSKHSSPTVRASKVNPSLKSPASSRTLSPPRKPPRMSDALQKKASPLIPKLSYVIEKKLALSPTRNKVFQLRSDKKRLKRLSTFTSAAAGKFRPSSLRNLLDGDEDENATDGFAEVTPGVLSRRNSSSTNNRGRLLKQSSTRHLSNRLGIGKVQTSVKHIGKKMFTGVKHFVETGVSRGESMVTEVKQQLKRQPSSFLIGNNSSDLFLSREASSAADSEESPLKQGLDFSLILTTPSKSPPFRVAEPMRRRLRSGRWASSSGILTASNPQSDQNKETFLELLRLKDCPIISSHVNLFEQLVTTVKLSAQEELYLTTLRIFYVRFRPGDEDIAGTSPPSSCTQRRPAILWALVYSDIISIVAQTKECRLQIVTVAPNTAEASKREWNIPFDKSLARPQAMISTLQSCSAQWTKKFEFVQQEIKRQVIQKRMQKAFHAALLRKRANAAVILAKISRQSTRRFTVIQPVPKLPLPPPSKQQALKDLQQREKQVLGELRHIALQNQEKKSFAEKSAALQYGGKHVRISAWKLLNLHQLWDVQKHRHKPDTFVSFAVFHGMNKICKHKSRTAKSAMDPHWLNNEFVFKLKNTDRHGTTYVRLRVYSQSKRVKKKKILGEAVVGFEQMVEILVSGKPAWIPLFPSLTQSMTRSLTSMKLIEQSSFAVGGLHSLSKIERQRKSVSSRRMTPTIGAVTEELDPEDFDLGMSSSASISSFHGLSPPAWSIEGQNDNHRDSDTPNHPTIEIVVNPVQGSRLQLHTATEDHKARSKALHEELRQLKLEYAKLHEPDSQASSVVGQLSVEEVDSSLNSDSQFSPILLPAYSKSAVTEIKSPVSFPFLSQRKSPSVEGQENKEGGKEATSPGASSGKRFPFVTLPSTNTVTTTTTTTTITTFTASTTSTTTSTTTGLNISDAQSSNRKELSSSGKGQSVGNSDTETLSSTSPEAVTTTKTPKKVSALGKISAAAIVKSQKQSTEIKQLRQALAKAQPKFEDEHRRATAAEARASLLESKLAKAEAIISRQNGEIKMLRSTNKEMENTISEKSRLFLHEKAKNSDLRTDVLALREQVSELGPALDMAVLRASRADDHIRQQEARQQALRHQIETIQTKAQKTTEQHIRQRENLEKALRESNRRVEQVGQVKERLEEEMNQLKEEILRQRSKDLQSQAQQRLYKTLADCQVMQARLQKLTDQYTQIRKATDDINDMRNTIQRQATLIQDLEKTNLDLTTLLESRQNEELSKLGSGLVQISSSRV